MNAQTHSVLLYVHGSAEMYGSDKVLFNLATAAAAEPHWDPVVVLHEDGPLCDALARAGVEVHVGAVAKIGRAMFTVAAPLTLWWQMRRSAQDIDRLLQGRKVAVVYSNTLAVLGGAFWALRHRIKHVWHVHEIILQPAAVSWGLPRLVSMLADRVICNSRQTEGWLLSRVPRLASLTSVIFNGIGPVPQPSATELDAFRVRVGAASNEVIVTLAGRLNRWKGHALLIEAAALLLREGRLGKMRIVMVGDTLAGQEEIRARMMKQVRDCGLDEYVRFVPFVSKIEVVWRASDIAVVPSLEPEPFGMVAIEAMACGLPVIAAAHGGLLDIVLHEETGLLFEPRDACALAQALTRLAADGELRRRLGAAGYARQRELFSLQRQVDMTREMLHDLGVV